MTSKAEKNAGEDGSSVCGRGGVGEDAEEEEEEEEGSPRVSVRPKSSKDQCNGGDEVVDSDSESILGHFVRTTKLLNGSAEEDNGGVGGGCRSYAQPPSHEEAVDPNMTESDKEHDVAMGATKTEAVIATNGHSFSNSVTTMTQRPRDDSGDSTVSSSTASSSSSSHYDACHDNNNFQPSTASPDYMNLALKQWSVYLGNVLLNFITKECKGDNRCNMQQQQQAQQQQQQQQDHNQASTSAAAATAGYCPCCHYHNQMAQQQQQQQHQQQQQPQLPQTPPQSNSQTSPQTPPPPLHQGYYNYAANFSPFLSAAAAAAAFASSSSSSSSSSSDHSQHFPHNNRIVASSPFFRGRGGGGCHYVRTNNVVVVVDFGLARIHSAELLSSLISHTKLVE